MITPRTSRRSGILTRRAPVASHLFAVGESVRLKSTVGSNASASAPYRVLAAMPARDGSPQYRIRNEAENHDRVAREDGLEATQASVAETLFGPTVEAAQPPRNPQGGEAGAQG